MSDGNMLDEMVMCVCADDVKFAEGFTEFDGPFCDAATHLYDLLGFASFKHRSKAEGDENLKQIIVYAIIKHGTHPFLDYVFRYARSGGDSRLIDNYSIGIGGHVNIVDLQLADFDHYETVIHALGREFGEEILYPDPMFPHLIGVINDNSDHVGRVHLGVVFEVKIDGALASLDENASDGKWADLDWLMEDLDEFESWSQLLILEYLGRA